MTRLRGKAAGQTERVLDRASCHLEKDSGELEQSENRRLKGGGRPAAQGAVWYPFQRVHPSREPSGTRKGSVRVFRGT